jgi:PAS domain S-box-containing protein
MPRALSVSDSCASPNVRMFSGRISLDNPRNRQGEDVPRLASHDTTAIGDGAFRGGEDALQFVESVLDASIEFSIIATNSAGVIQLWNKGAQRLYGYAPSEIIGWPQSVLHTEEDQARGLSATMMRRAQEDEKWEGTVERRRKDGSTFTARVMLTPRRQSDGRVIGFLLISRDITEEQRLVADWERSQYMLSVLESAPDAMVIIDAAGEIRLANAEMERLFGYTRHDMVGRPVEMLIPDRYRDRHPGHRMAFFSEPRVRPMGAELELFGRRRDGVEFAIEISLSPLATEDGLLATAAIRDVTERRRIEQDLRDANAKLEEAGRAKDRFLANMSHELRTPLNAILGFTGTLLMGLPGPLNAAQTKQLRTVQASSRHLLSLINDLLDLARIEAGKLELKIEAIDCRELLDEVVVGLRPLADAKGLELDVCPPEQGLTVHSDRRALSQILINFANNAIKFTDRGHVLLDAVRGTRDGVSVARFTVVDTGCGIRAADQERLFAAFEQIKSTSAEPYEGTGLGLYICQTLADFIGASITFDSTFGQGSSFVLELPE